MSYQNLIISEFESRKNRNSMYSLRSFADQIGLSPGRLSQVLRGKAGISVKRAKDLSFKLFKDEKQRELFVCLVEARQSKSEIVRKHAQEKLKTYFAQESFNLSFEKFSVIKDWYHFSILEMTELSFFKSDLNWIAEQLGISLVKTKEAILRLEKLGLIDLSKEPWQQTTKDLGTTNGISNYSVREHHKQILLEVYNKIDTTALEDRFLNSTTMAVCREKIPEAKKALKKFRDEFCAELQNSSEKDAIYCLSMQLFPMLKEGEKK